MKNNIKLSDFKFTYIGYGRYMVTYQSPVTGKNYSRSTNDMPLIDATKNCESPLVADLLALKRMCKS